MEELNICPYCGAEMDLGHIHGDRYNLKFIPDETDKGPILQWFSKGIKLGYSVESYYCKECRKIIIDEEKQSQNK